MGMNAVGTSQDTREGERRAGGDLTPRISTAITSR